MEEDKQINTYVKIVILSKNGITSMVNIDCGLKF